MLFHVDCLVHLRLMIGREVGRPLWVVLGRSRGLSGQSWAALGAYLEALGLSRGLSERSWAALAIGCLGPLSGPLRVSRDSLRPLLAWLAWLGLGWPSWPGRPGGFAPFAGFAPFSPFAGFCRISPRAQYQVVLYYVIYIYMYIIST